ESNLFDVAIADISKEMAAGVPYVSSSATSGAFPHQPSQGATSYYGVGAYLRPLDDARRSEVRFASECLAFANVPSAASLSASPILRSVRAHHPKWKARVPRDLGAGWDFEDVRDHYLARLFDVDPVQLRSVDHARYLELSRIVSGEVMAESMGEWRRSRSVTRGALVLSLRDLAMGAGWGVIDAHGEAKPAWHFLRRALAPIALALTDEGLNGLDAHVVNDRSQPFDGRLDVVLLRDGEQLVDNASLPIRIAPNAAIEMSLASLFDRFIDLNHAYHFGPSSHDIVAATLRNASGALVSQAFHFVGGRSRHRELALGVTARVTPGEGDDSVLTLATQRFAQWVCVDVPRYDLDDNYFHLLPGVERHVRMRARGAVELREGTVQPVNCETTTRIMVG
ncbi:MAG: glycoside hydrolase family 2 protein, partial [Gemmatimonadaceae bacterium]